jgi:hypothetical protein
MKTTVKPGQLCPTCGLRRDEVYADGQRILYGQGVAKIVVTPEGQKFVIKTLVKDIAEKIMRVAATVVSDPKYGSEDQVYREARDLLDAIADIPTTMRFDNK